MKRHVLPGIIDKTGRVDPRPVIVDLDSDGNVVAFEMLEGHEPPFTTPLYAMLRLEDLALIKG